MIVTSFSLFIPCYIRWSCGLLILFKLVVRLDIIFILALRENFLLCSTESTALLGDAFRSLLNWSFFFFESHGCFLTTFLTLPIRTQFHSSNLGVHLGDPSMSSITSSVEERLDRDLDLSTLCISTYVYGAVSLVWVTTSFCSINWCTSSSWFDIDRAELAATTRVAL